MEEDVVILSAEDFAEMNIKAPPKKREEYIKPVVEYTLDGDFIRNYESTTEASKIHKLNASTIHNICRGIALFSRRTNTTFLYRGNDIAERVAKIKESMTKLPAHSSSHKTVHEYTIGGRFLFKWDSGVMAARIYKIKPYLIYKCCKGKVLFINNRIFLYPGDDIKQRVKEVKAELYKRSKKRPKLKPVDEYTIDGTFVKGYPSASAAGRANNISVSSITRCCTGGDKYKVSLTAKGKIFLWVGDSISERLKLIKQRKENR